MGHATVRDGDMIPGCVGPNMRMQMTEPWDRCKRLTGPCTRLCIRSNIREHIGVAVDQPEPVRVADVLERIRQRHEA